MYSTSIEVSGAMLDPAAVEAQMRSPTLPKIVGEAVAEVLRDHFEDLNHTRHGKGGSSTGGFYEMAARGTKYTVQFGGPSVVVMMPDLYNGALAQRFFGGTITAKNGKYLAWGLIPETRGHSPTEFSGLEVVFGRQKDTGNIGPIALKASEDENWTGDETFVHHQQHSKDPFTGKWEEVGKRGKELKMAIEVEGRKTKKKVGVGGILLFWLQHSVQQNADETVLPPQDELQQAGYEAAVGWFSRHGAPTVPVNERIQS